MQLGKSPSPFLIFLIFLLLTGFWTDTILTAVTLVGTDQLSCREQDVTCPQSNPLPSKKERKISIFFFVRGSVRKKKYVDGIPFAFYTLP